MHELCRVIFQYRIFFSAENFNDLYRMLIRISYLTPFTERLVPAVLPLFNLFGRMGLSVLRRKRKGDIKMSADGLSKNRILDHSVVK